MSPRFAFAFTVTTTAMPGQHVCNVGDLMRPKIASDGPKPFYKWSGCSSGVRGFFTKNP
jgi:hypothetical protein